MLTVCEVHVSAYELYTVIENHRGGGRVQVIHYWNVYTVKDSVFDPHPLQTLVSSLSGAYEPHEAGLFKAPSFAKNCI